MAALFGSRKTNFDNVEFWHNPERAGWLMKQGTVSLCTAVQFNGGRCKPRGATSYAMHVLSGEYIKTWRRR